MWVSLWRRVVHRISRRPVHMRGRGGWLLAHKAALGAMEKLLLLSKLFGATSPAPLGCNFVPYKACQAQGKTLKLFTILLYDTHFTNYDLKIIIDPTK